MFDYIKTHHRKFSFALLAFFVIVSLYGVKNDAITYDEVAHIPAGFSYVTQGDYRINPEHPPILKVLAGLPLLPLGLNFDTSLPFWNELSQYGEYDQWAAGRHILFEAGNNTDLIVTLARIPTVILALFFGLFLFRWGRERVGVIGGLVVLALYVFDPNILGHNHYVTTDLGIAFAITLAFYYFIRFLKEPTWTNVVIGGAFLGVAQLTKFSAVLLVPFFGLLLILYALTRDRGEHNRFAVIGSYLGKGLCAIGVMFVLIYIVYIPVTLNMGPEVLQGVGPGRILNTQEWRNQAALDLVLSLNESSLTRPLGTYAQGVIQVFHRIAGGNGAYFLGEVIHNGTPAYFPFVFATKSTIPHLLFYLFGVFIFVVFTLRTLKRLFTQSLRDSHTACVMFIQTHFTLIALTAFIIFYAMISITGTLTIGLRHLFPIIPLIYLVVVEGGVLYMKRLRNKHTVSHLKIIGGVIVIFMAIETVLAFPYYMSYFNQFVGGPKNGYNYVGDSNADWGQDLRRLDTYINEHPEIAKIRLNYFGGDRPERFFGDRYDGWWDSRRPIEKGYYAISVNFRQESLFSKDADGDASYHWLFDVGLAQRSNPDITNITFIDQIGTSLLIYKVE